MSDEYDFIIRAGSRINLYAWAANGSGLFLTESDKPWLTILCSTGLGALYLVLAHLYFSKRDIKLGNNHDICNLMCYGSNNTVFVS